LDLLHVEVKPRWMHGGGALGDIVGNGLEMRGSGLDCRHGGAEFASDRPGARVLAIAPSLALVVMADYAAMLVAGAPIVSCCGGGRYLLLHRCVADGGVGACSSGSLNKGIAILGFLSCHDKYLSDACPCCSR
jgi:hypothetical protein